ncbi:MAG: type II toxin-antitoxin system PemK/MazF family toxin [Pirellulales bacterium]
MNRGDVVLVDFPYTSGPQSKVRPAIVVQNDRDNQRLTKTIVAMVTGNVRRAGEPTHLVIDPATPEHATAGLHAKSLVVCVNLHPGPAPFSCPCRGESPWQCEAVALA